MWLLALVLLHCFSGGIQGAYAFSDILRCSRMRSPFPITYDLAEAPEDLDKLCKEHENFYNCLRDVAMAEKYSGQLPPEIDVARSLMKDLCSEGSKWRRRYLQQAPCINSARIDFCVSLKFLSSIMNDQSDPTMCSLLEKSLDCIGSVLSIKCGPSAGRLFNMLYRIGTDNDHCVEDTSTNSFSNAKTNITENLELPEGDLLLKKTGSSARMEKSDESYALSFNDGKIMPEIVVDHINTETCYSLNCNSDSDEHSCSINSFCPQVKYLEVMIGELKINMFRFPGGRVRIQWKEDNILVGDVMCHRSSISRSLFNCVFNLTRVSRDGARYEHYSENNEVTEQSDSIVIEREKNEYGQQESGILKEVNFLDVFPSDDALNYFVNPGTYSDFSSELFSKEKGSSQFATRNSKTVGIVPEGCDANNVLYNEICEIELDVPPGETDESAAGTSSVLSNIANELVNSCPVNKAAVNSLTEPITEISVSGSDVTEESQNHYIESRSDYTLSEAIFQLLRREDQSLLHGGETKLPTLKDSITVKTEFIIPNIDGAGIDASQPEIINIKEATENVGFGDSIENALLYNEVEAYSGCEATTLSPISEVTVQSMTEPTTETSVSDFDTTDETKNCINGIASSLQPETNIFNKDETECQMDHLRTKILNSDTFNAASTVCNNCGSGMDHLEHFTDEIHRIGDFEELNSVVVAEDYNRDPLKCQEGEESLETEREIKESYETESGEEYVKIPKYVLNVQEEMSRLFRGQRISTSPHPRNLPDGRIVAQWKNEKFSHVDSIKCRGMSNAIYCIIAPEVTSSRASPSDESMAQSMTEPTTETSVLGFDFTNEINYGIDRDSYLFETNILEQDIAVHQLDEKEVDEYEVLKDSTLGAESTQEPTESIEQPVERVKEAKIPHPLLHTSSQYSTNEADQNYDSSNSEAFSTSLTESEIVPVKDHTSEVETYLVINPSDTDKSRDGYEVLEIDDIKFVLLPDNPNPLSYTSEIFIQREVDNENMGTSLDKSVSDDAFDSSRSQQVNYSDNHDVTLDSLSVLSDMIDKANIFKSTGKMNS